MFNRLTSATRAILNIIYVPFLYSSVRLFLFLNYPFFHRFHEDEKTIETQLKLVRKWMISHIEDDDEVLKRSDLFSKYGLSKIEPKLHHIRPIKDVRNNFEHHLQMCKEKLTGSRCSSLAI